MFKPEKKAKNNTEFSKEQNKIAQGTKVTGNIEAQGGFRIDGCVEGSVKTPGEVVIGREGSVTGDLECANADIEGNFSGNLKVTEVLSLRSTAFVEGEAALGKLAVEPGAVFNATCVMKSGLKAIVNEKGERRQKEQSA